MSERPARLVLAVFLIPTVAHASFNAAPCGTFGCHFQVMGILLGVIGGLPVSSLIFIGLHMGFAHPERSRIKQLFLGGIVGLVAFEIAAAAGAYYAVWRHPPGYRGGFPWEAFLVTYVLLAILSVLYVRSVPRSTRETHQMRRDVYRPLTPGHAEPSPTELECRAKMARGSVQMGRDTELPDIAEIVRGILQRGSQAQQLILLAQYRRSCREDSDAAS